MNIKLIPFQQKWFTIYWFVCNPNLIYERSTFKNIVDWEENAQRPYNKSRVKEIEKYILWNDTISKNTSLNKKAIWLIPNSIILNVPKKYIQNNEIMFNEEDEKDIEILDWQHRLLAFTKDNMGKIGNPYEVFFIAFIELNIEMKQEIFMVVNERQQNVDKNILLRQKKLLWILLNEDEIRYDFISKMWNDINSPLFWKIIFTKETIKHWIKTVQLEDVIKKSNLMTVPWILHNWKIQDKWYEAVIDFLKSWKENYEKQWFQWSTITKISWFRLLFQLFQSYATVIRSNFDSKFSLANSKTITSYIINEHFNEDFDVNSFVWDTKVAFRERSMTEALAKKIWDDIISHFKAEDNVFFK